MNMRTILHNENFFLLEVFFPSLVRLSVSDENLKFNARRLVMTSNDEKEVSTNELADYFKARLSYVISILLTSPPSTHQLYFLIANISTSLFNFQLGIVQKIQKKFQLKTLE